MNKIQSPKFSSPVFFYDLMAIDKAGKVLFYNRMGNPLLHFPNMQIENQPANIWLYRNILDPLLKRWGTHGLSGKDLLNFINKDVVETVGRIKKIFRAILNEGLKHTDTALLAVASVVFGLIRTILTLRDFMSGEKLSVRKKHSRSNKPIDTREFEAEVLWCGLTYYPEGSRYFISKVENPSNPESLRPNHTDPGYLRNLFRCSNKVITEKCQQGLQKIRKHVLESEDLVMTDVGCLLSQSYPATPDESGE